jgi:type IV pilus biogenesis protein CpaD/CtpE
MDMALTVDRIILTILATLVSGSAIAGNIGVKCIPDENPSEVPLVSFEIANNASARLVSDLQEARTANDVESLPSFLVSQFYQSPSSLRVEMDDGSAEGNQMLLLHTIGERLPAKNSSEARPLYAIWSGSYERLDAGRQLKVDVTCFGAEIK